MPDARIIARLWDTLNLHSPVAEECKYIEYICTNFKFSVAFPGQTDQNRYGVRILTNAVSNLWCVHAQHSSWRCRHMWKTPTRSCNRKLKQQEPVVPFTVDKVADRSQCCSIYKEDFFGRSWWLQKSTPSPTAMSASVVCCHSIRPWDARRSICEKSSSCAHILGP
jgi:hypothetical protein